MAESYWNSIKKALASYVGQGLASPVKAMSSGFAASTAGKAGAPTELQQQIGQAAGAPVEAAGQAAGKAVVGAITKPAEVVRADRAFDLGMREVDKFYQWAYPKVSQPATAALLTSADVIAGRSIDLAKNWELGRKLPNEPGVIPNVSPGQAAVYNVLQFVDPHFNIADPEDRKKTFQKNIFGKVSSGLLDGALMWYADPLVWVGKGAKVAREAALIQPIQSAEDVIRVRSELDSHGAYLASNGVIGRPTPMGVVAERLTGKTAAEALDDIFVRRSNDPYLLSSLVGEAKTYEDTANFIAAASGDKASLAKIAATRASVADEIERSQNLLDSMQKKYLNIEWGSLKSVEASQPTIQEYDRLTNVLEDLKLRDQNLAKAMTQNLGDYRLVNEFTSAADVNLFNKNIGVAIEKARAKGSELRHDFTFYTETFQKSPYTRPVAVIQAAFNKLPRGLVRIDGGGLADSGSEIKYALNSVKPLRSAEFIPVKNELYREYANARNATERLAAVQHIESEIADIIALERGLTIEEARRWYGAYASVRRGMMDTFSRYGFWVDEGTGALVTSPFWKSEMPNVVPMMDFKDFDNFLSIYQKTRPIGETTAEVALKSRAAVNEAGDMLDFANSLFKASVLTRMGYPVRNTIDGQLRALLTLGTLAKSDDVIKNLTKNAKTRIKQAAEFVDETVTLSNPAQLRDQIGKLVTQRGQVVDVRNSILDELSPKQYYAGAAGTFGKQITPGDVELAISSKTKPLLKESERNQYFELIAKQKEQKGLLFGKDRDKLRQLQSKAYGKYVRDEVVPNLPKGTSLVYLDFPSGKVFYKIPGKTGRIPSAAIPEIEARKGIPSAALADELEMNGLINVRGKGPIEHPDIRVITDYDVARGNNFKEIADLLGEEQMYRINHYQKMIDDYDAKILEKVNQSQELAKIRSELKIVKSGETDVKVISPTGKEVNAAGAFAGPRGALVRAEVSSDNTLNWLTEGQSYLTFDAAKGVHSKTYAGKLSQNRTVVQPTDPQYYNEMSVFANRILRNDQLAMQILQNKPDKEIIKWLQSSKGSFYLREINADVAAVDVASHVAEARSRIYSLFPDPQMRSLIAREELSPEQFDLLMRGNPNLMPIAGRSIVEDTLRYNKGIIKQGINNGISKIFKVIGSTPENNLVAWPFYQNLYLRNLKNEVKIAEGLGKDIQNPDIILQMERTAHAASLKTTNEVLYRIANNTGMSNVLRFVIPFFNAQYNAVKVYGKFFLEDPSRIARGSQIWNAPNNIARVVDQDGNPVPEGEPPSTQQYILFTLPKGLQGRFGIPKGYDVSIPKNSLNVFLMGDNPLFPSFGLPVTISVSKLANSRPDRVEKIRTFLDEFVGPETSKVVMNSIMPFGRAPANPWDLLLPAAGQKVAQLQAGLDDVTYGRAVASAMKTQYYQWYNNGQVGPQPTFDDAIKLANQLYKIRIAVNLALPFTFTFRPEWQPIIDDYRKALLDPTVGKTKVDDYILNKYGDIGYLMTAPTSRNKTNLNPTIGAVTNSRKYGKLLGEMDKLNVPGLVGFIANYGNNYDKYSDSAANYFRNKSVRPGGDIKYTEARATEDVLTDRQESLGWSYYEKFAKQRDAVMAKYGIKSLQSKAAKSMGLDVEWEKAVDSIKAYLPAWAEAYDNSVGDYTKTKRYIKGLIKISQDKTWNDQFGNSTTMEAVKDYLANRAYVAKELEKRKSSLGTKGLTDPMNADIKDQWDEYILKLKLWDSQFNDLYTRYLENDNYEVIG